MHIFFGIPALESWVMRQSGVVVCLRSAHLDCSHWATAVWYSCPDQQQQELAGQAVIIILQLWKRWLFLIESSGTYLAKTSLLLKRVEMERFIQEKTRLLEMKEWIRLISLFILARDHQNMAGAVFIHLNSWKLYILYHNNIIIRILLMVYIECNHFNVLYSYIIHYLIFCFMNIFSMYFNNS